MAKQRKVPLRKCLVTKELMPKEDLIRLVKTKENKVLIDPSGKMNGRGAYLSYSKDVFLKAKEENLLSQAFKMKIDSQIYDDLLALISDNNE